MPDTISTRVLVLSDTHGEALKRNVTTPADVAIHCGDLTEESKLHEFQTAIEQLKVLSASLKLVIAGNHDFTLDDDAFARVLNETDLSIDADLLTETFGKVGDARRLFDAADVKQYGIVYLTEGTHSFNLKNGARLIVYASPYTPSVSTGWGFTYDPQDQSKEHEWLIPQGVDIAITHGPARGVLDYTDSRTRAGSPSLFAAIARAKPKIHCSGHIHEAWGAKLVTWQSEFLSSEEEEASHFTAINNDESRVIESLSTLRRGRFDSEEDVLRKQERVARYEEQGCCEVDARGIRQGKQTLCVNAAVEGESEDEQCLPWLVEIELLKVTSEAESEKCKLSDDADRRREGSDDGKR